MTNYRAQKQKAGAIPSIHQQIQCIANSRTLPEKYPPRTGIRIGRAKSCTFCTCNVQFPARRPGMAFSACAIIELCVLLSHMRSDGGNERGDRLPHRPPVKRRDLPRRRPRRQGKRSGEFPRRKVFLTLTERPHLCIGHTFCQAARMSVAEHSGRLSPPFPLHACDRQRGTPQAIYTRGSRYALAQEIRNSRFGGQILRKGR